MQPEEERTKRLIQLALPHDFGTTLRYIDTKTIELAQMLLERGPLVQYKRRYRSDRRLMQIREAVEQLDHTFEEFWENEELHANYSEMQRSFDNDIVPIIDVIVDKCEELKGLLARIRKRERMYSAHRSHQAAASIADDLLDKIIYFSNRSRYYIIGLGDLMQFRPVDKPELTNLNVFISGLNEFFGIKGTPEAVIAINKLPTVSIDYSHCFYIFSNLLKNSLKYRRGSRASIRVACEANEDDTYKLQDLPNYVPLGKVPDGFVRLHFVDEGRGISDNNLKAIFRPFKRGIENDRAAEEARKLDGSDAGGISIFSYSDMGIGLAIVERVVSLYNGRVTAHSTLGRGTCMTISIPKSLVRNLQ